VSARRHELTHPVLGPVTWRELQAHSDNLRKAEKRRVCGWCFGEVPQGRRTRCNSLDCKAKIEEHSSWNTLRMRVLREAKRICAICTLPKAGEVDHIVPVCEGGTGDRSNLRAICHDCHLKETAALAKRRAKRKPDCLVIHDPNHIQIPLFESAAA
jgi:5-methylcytosine-specific restriction endonuclease McrA